MQGFGRAPVTLGQRAWKKSARCASACARRSAATASAPAAAAAAGAPARGAGGAAPRSAGGSAAPAAAGGAAGASASAASPSAARGTCGQAGAHAGAPCGMASQARGARARLAPCMRHSPASEPAGLPLASAGSAATCRDSALREPLHRKHARRLSAGSLKRLKPATTERQPLAPYRLPNAWRTPPAWAAAPPASTS